ncbi:kelch repeat and BTB domain-containing protein 7-like [Scleropages formosus]|uniref:Kelch repeat and BTB domain-containing protein 7-like n=1 Tax=Scleropages formosus TaxID=113540 RepID=A0A0P7Y946_SCLFO|nr:kelch repeat and BTB domain-containing protein 7-like [Scleropages formosus]
MHESAQEAVTIRDVDAHSMSLIIDYCYTGKVCITEANVQRLYAAANMLQLDYIRGACAGFMSRRLDLSNCAGILKFAEAFDNRELKSKAQAFIARNFLQLCTRNRELSELELDHMKEILSMDSLDVDSERTPCLAALQWVEDNATARAEDAGEILKCVRWHLFTEKDRFYLEEMKARSRARKHLEEFLDGVLSRLSNGVESGATGPTHRIGKNAKEMIVFFGRPNEPFVCYDPSNEEVCSMASPVMNLSILGTKRSVTETFSVCVSPDNDMYLLSNISKHFWLYDPVLNRWQELAERLLGRVHSDMCYLGGHLYVLGGRDPVTDARLKDVECYSVQRNQWTLVAPLPHSLGKMQTLSVNDRLYVVNKRRILCYDPKRNQWIHSASLSSNKLHRACVFQDQIFCLFDIPVTKAYSPDRGEWRRIEDIPIDSNALQYHLVQHSKRLLLLTVAVAHHSKHRLVVHEYDPLRDCWVIWPSRLVSSFGSTCVSARMYPACLGSGMNASAEEEDDSGSSADWDFDGLTDVDSDSGSSSSFSDENW